MPERLAQAEPGTSLVPESWSKNDVLAFSITKGAAVTLWTLRLPDKRASAFGGVRSIGIPTNAMFSPDGRWVAYTTGDETSDRYDVIVQPFPATGEIHPISNGRAARPIWSPDGTELFLQSGLDIFAVTIKTRPRFSIGDPVPLPYGGRVTRGGPFRARNRDVMPLSLIHI